MSLIANFMRYQYVPPATDSRLDHMGTYKRTLPVALERMYENALDWEHLPHLHSSSFQSISLLDGGAWGWRAEVTGARASSILELHLDRDCRRWITRNLEGPSKGAEIWTHVFVTEPRQLDLVIDFFVPGVPREKREKLGRAYATQYETLYDEDVWMMTERQRQLDLRVDGLYTDHVLEMPLPARAQLPLLITMAGRNFMVNQHAEQWVVYPAACPHQLGPLTGELNAAGEVECPWHGYRFDVVSRHCTTGAACRLGKVPSLQVTKQGLALRL